MSGLKETSDVVVIAITNKPWMLDSGLISRFTKRIYLPLPGKIRYWTHMYYSNCVTLDDATREEMFRAYLDNISNSLADKDFKVNCCYLY